MVVFYCKRIINSNAPSHGGEQCKCQSDCLEFTGILNQRPKVSWSRRRHAACRTQRKFLLRSPSTIHSRKQQSDAIRQRKNTLAPLVPVKEKPSFRCWTCWLAVGFPVIHRLAAAVIDCGCYKRYSTTHGLVNSQIMRAELRHYQDRLFRKFATVNGYLLPRCNTREFSRRSRYQVLRT